MSRNLQTKRDNCHITVKMSFNMICLRRLLLWVVVVMIAVHMLVYVISQNPMLTMSKITNFFRTIMGPECLQCVKIGSCNFNVKNNKIALTRI